MPPLTCYALRFPPTILNDLLDLLIEQGCCELFAEEGDSNSSLIFISTHRRRGEIDNYLASILGGHDWSMQEVPRTHTPFTTGPHYSTDAKKFRDDLSAAPKRDVLLIKTRSPRRG